MRRTRTSHARRWRAVRRQAPLRSTAWFREPNIEFLEVRHLLATAVVLDSESGTGVTRTGDWIASTGVPGFLGSNYLHDGNAGKGQKSVTFRPNLPAAGQYEVFLRWTSHPNRVNNAPVDIEHRDGRAETRVNQQINGGKWVSVGRYVFEAGTRGSVQISNFKGADNGYVIADAVRFIFMGSPPSANGPEIDVLDGAKSIADGGTLNFGTTSSGAPIDKVLTVRNQGNQNLTLTPIDGGNLPNGFSLVSNFGNANLPPGDSTTFTVRMLASSAGSPNGSLIFNNNDDDENPYNFIMKGTVSSTPVSSDVVLDSESGLGITRQGTWLASTGAPGFLGANYLHDGNAGKGKKSVRFTPNLSTAGQYEVFLRWTSHSNRATNVPVAIQHLSAITQRSVNQRNQGGQWVSLGTFQFSAGSSGNVLLSNQGTNGFVIADAVRFVRVGDPPAPAPEIDLLVGQTPLADGSTINFGTTPPDTPVNRMVTVRNLGTQTLALTALDGGAFPAGFSLVSNITTTELAPGASTSFTVQLTAASLGQYTGGIAVANSDSDENPYNLTLRGTVALPPVINTIDDGTTGYRETGIGWGSGRLVGAFQGDYRYHLAGKGTNTATWTFAVTPGVYRVSTTWIAYSNRASDATFTVSDGDRILNTVAVNQKKPPNNFSDAGVAWEDLGGPYVVLSNFLTVELTDKANGIVIADAVRIERTSVAESLELSDTSLSPGEKLILTGASPFSAASHADVLFLADDGTVTEVPITRVDPAGIEIPVPPFFNDAAGDFTAGSVRIAVVQGSRVYVAQQSLQIGELPDPGFTTGDLTLAMYDNMLGVLGLTLQRWQTIQSSSGGRVNAEASLALIREQIDLLVKERADIERLVKGTVNELEFGEVNGERLPLKRAAVHYFDQLLAAYLADEDLEFGPTAAGTGDPAPSGGDSTPPAPGDRLFHPTAEGEEETPIAKAKRRLVELAFGPLEIHPGMTPDEVSEEILKAKDKFSNFLGVVGGVMGVVARRQAGKALAARIAAGPFASVGIVPILVLWIGGTITRHLGDPNSVPCEQYHELTQALVDEASGKVVGVVKDFVINGLRVVARRGGFKAASANLVRRAESVVGAFDSAVSLFNANDPSSVAGQACASRDTLTLPTFGVAVLPAAGLIDDQRRLVTDEDELLQASFMVGLYSRPVGDITIHLAPDAQNEGRIVLIDGKVPADNSIRFPRASYFFPHMVTVVGVDDNVPDGDKSYLIITAQATSSALEADLFYHGLDPPDVSLVNLDNDGGVEMELIDGQTSEAGDRGSVRLRLKTKPSANVTISLRSTDTTEGRLAVSSRTFTQQDWNQFQTVEVIGVDDTVPDGNINYVVEVTSISSTDLRYKNLSITDLKRNFINLDNDKPKRGELLVRVNGSGYVIDINNPNKIDTRVAGRNFASYPEDSFPVLESRNFNNVAVRSNWPSDPPGACLNFTFGCALIFRDLANGLTIDVQILGLEADPEAAVDPAADLLPLAPLGAGELSRIASAALDRLESAGVSGAAIERLAQVPIRMADLPGRQLGQFGPDGMLIDMDAAGFGWFVDATPWEDEEFFDVAGTTTLSARSDGAAAGRMDLVTVLMHEFAHALGLDDLSAEEHAAELMAESLWPGVRKLPWSAAVDGLFESQSLFASHNKKA